MGTQLRPARRTKPSLTVRIRSRGTGRETVKRVGWSAREAGLLADDVPIPSRTVEHWAATGLVGPTVRPGLVWPRNYADPAARVYGLGDVIAVRLARDLLGRGMARDVVAAVTPSVAGWGPEQLRDWRAIAGGSCLYEVPSDMEGVEAVRDGGAEPGWVVHEDDLWRVTDGCDVVDTGDGWRELHYEDESPMLLYPVGTVAAGIVERVDYWLIGKGMPRTMLAEWL